MPVGIYIIGLYIGITSEEVQAICCILISHYLKYHKPYRLRLHRIRDDVVETMMHSLARTFDRVSIQVLIVSN